MMKWVGGDAEKGDAVVISGVTMKGRPTVPVYHTSVPLFSKQMKESGRGKKD